MLLKFSYTEDGSIEDFRGDILSSSGIGPIISLQSIKACLIDITSDPRLESCLGLTLILVRFGSGQNDSKRLNGGDDSSGHPQIFHPRKRKLIQTAMTIRPMQSLLQIELYPILPICDKT